jgi:dihydroorotate dehydrogenase electron transfer subunit
MAVVRESREVASGVHEIWVDNVKGAGEARPGQFFQVRGWRNLDPFLPRPLSVHDVDGGSVSFLFQVKGRGTRLLAGLKAGDWLEAAGPLGNGFTLNAEPAVFVAGGLGLAPLHYAVKAYKAAGGVHASVYLGFSAEPFKVGEFQAVADEVFTSVGGFVTDLVHVNGAACYACGPEGMLAALHAKVAGRAAVQVSLERRMACGLGACYACSIRTASGMRRVCKEGPVFDSSEVF